MKKIISYSALILVLLLNVFSARADEGMWLPQLLQKLNESRMKSLGMKISAADIYSINKGSLKDAIVIFGGGCTGEIISNNGLLLTNHHCGFDAIQNHSSLEHNYLKHGFWAKNYGEELPNKGLSVTFIARIDDVTKQAMEGITAQMAENERQSRIDKNLAEVRKQAKKESWQDVMTRGFFEGNQYYLFVTETYKDVRLAGAPPSSIGNFGKDTDNWMWPRHTGDFSIFRIYADKNNRPAEYAPDNVPFKPKRSLKISLDGIAENDFTMVFGFPGRTTEYLHSAAVEQIRTVNDPAKIAVRNEALKIIDGYMRADEGIKIMYASKYAGIQNAYKKWQGEVQGLTAKDAYSKKKNYEQEFQRRVMGNAVLKEKYGTLLADMEAAYNDFKPYGLARDYYTELVSKIELYNISSNLLSLISAYNRGGEKAYAERLKVVKGNVNGILDEFNLNVDKSLMSSMMKIYQHNMDSKYIAPAFNNSLSAAGNDIDAMVKKAYSQTELYDRSYLNALFEKSPSEAMAAIESFETVNLFRDMLLQYQDNVQKPMAVAQEKINRLQRTYMQAQMDVFKEKQFYPDANSTMRVTYGKVQGYNPRDAVYYHYQTTLDGVMEKYKPGDYEFDLPAKLIELWKNKDYGKYGKNGVMPVCFIATNHTTGGNSGSPALDAYGNLIGLNFDRVWEGTMSDINYDPSICRNVMVDIRYVMFIIDKFAAADNLMKEFTFVYPKTKKK